MRLLADRIRRLIDEGPRPGRHRRAAARGGRHAAATSARCASAASRRTWSAAATTGLSSRWPTCARTWRCWRTRSTRRRSTRCSGRRSAGCPSTRSACSGCAARRLERDPWWALTAARRLGGAGGVLPGRRPRARAGARREVEGHRALRRDRAARTAARPGRHRLRVRPRRSSRCRTAAGGWRTCES